MCRTLTIEFSLLLCLLAVANGAVIYRQKRVSDQRLAELETLVALSGLRGKLKTIPYGYGSIDPEKIGRRRRSTSTPWPVPTINRDSTRLLENIGEGQASAMESMLAYDWDDVEQKLYNKLYEEYNDNNPVDDPIEETDRYIRSLARIQHRFNNDNNNPPLLPRIYDSLY